MQIASGLHGFLSDVLGKTLPQAEAASGKGRLKNDDRNGHHRKEAVSRAENISSGRELGSFSTDRISPTDFAMISVGLCSSFSYPVFGDSDKITFIYRHFRILRLFPLAL